MALLPGGKRVQERGGSHGCCLWLEPGYAICGRRRGLCAAGMRMRAVGDGLRGRYSCRRLL